MPALHTFSCRHEHECAPLVGRGLGALVRGWYHQMSSTAAAHSHTLPAREGRRRQNCGQELEAQTHWQIKLPTVLLRLRFDR